MLLLLFCKGDCKLAVNRHQGVYDNGKVLPQVYPERVLDLHHQGFSQRQISQNMRVSVGYVNKVEQFYENNNSSLAAPRTTPVRSKMSADVVEYLESEKLCKPTMYTSELQQRLLLNGVSPPGQLPSTSTIKKCVREDCRMTKKKVSQVPKESLLSIYAAKLKTALWKTRALRAANDFKRAVNALAALQLIGSRFIIRLILTNQRR